ncbi:MAG TPA: hypothetical protein V6C89_04495 [Drouetiella sp.]
MSQFHLLSDDEIMSALSDHSNVIRAVSFDRTTKYAAIELPNHSPYLEISAFRKLIELLNSLGLKPRIYTASGSRDVQLFLFFTEAYKCSLVQESLAKVLSWNGFSLRADKLVVYPSDVALPLPLQRGFVWLNEDLQPIVSRTEIALDSALALFCSEASRYSTDFERVIDGANLLPSADLTAAEFWGLNPNKVEADAIECTREDAEPEAVMVDSPITHITETGSFVEVHSQDDFYSSANVTKLPLHNVFAGNDDIEDSLDDLDGSLDDLDGSLDDLDVILEPTSSSASFTSVPEETPAKTESLKAFPLWLVEEELGVEVFPVPADQETLEDMLVEENNEEELEQVVTQGQPETDLWPRQSSQLLLVTNEPSPDVQLDLFSRKNLNRVDQQQPPRPRRKRPRFDETKNPEE